MTQHDDLIERAKKLIQKDNENTSLGIGQSGNKCNFDTPIDLAKADMEMYQAAPHHLKIQDKLLEAFHKEKQRKIVNIPPQHGKSLLVSKYYIAWLLIQDPSLRIIFNSYSHVYATRWSIEVRDVLQRWSNVKLRDDQCTKNYFVTEDGGYLYSTGMGGSLTGMSADIYIIDDPVKNAETAASESYRRQAKDYFLTVANTRLTQRGSIVIIQTRWHEDDLAGWLMNSNPELWDVLNLPALDEDNNALWPEQYDAEYLQGIKEMVGNYVFSALYQGNPQPIDGGILKRDWIKRGTYRHDELADDGVMCIDLAISQEKTADYTAICTVYMTRDNHIYVKGLRYGRWGNNGNKQNFLSEYGRLRPGSCYVETNNFQRVFREDMINEHNIPIMGIQNSGNKETRILTTLQPLLEAGKIVFDPSIDLDDEFMQEYLSFPLAKHDDLLDALQMCCSKVAMCGNPYVTDRNVAHYDMVAPSVLQEDDYKPGSISGQPRRRKNSPYSIRI